MSVSVEEAQRLLMAAAGGPLETERIAAASTLGRAAAEDVAAPYQLPLFDRSPLDGYAMRAEDIRQAAADAPVYLKVIEEYRAGCVPHKPVTRGTASKLMTGAPMPQGADVVIKYEDVERRGDEIKVTCALKPNANVIFAGEDVRRGERIVRRGDRINAARIGALAAVGAAEVLVGRRVGVALLTTGDELHPAGSAPAAGKIFNSNLPFLCAACEAAGARVVSAGSAADRREKLTETLKELLGKADLVITTGGVSAGDYDFIPACFQDVGAEILFRGVALKPGSPALAAKYGDKILLGLSGNAAAAAVTFQLLAIPLLKKMMGLRDCQFARTNAILMDGFPKKSPQRRFLRARFLIEEGGNKVFLTDGQGNGAVQSLMECNALVDVAAGSGGLCAGMEVSVVLTGEL